MIWSKSAYPVPDLVPHRSRPVPDRSRSFPDRSMESNLMEEEFSGQCKIIWCFWGRIHTDYNDSIHSVPDVRNRRFTKVTVPDVRITAERSRPVYWCIAICRAVAQTHHRHTKTTRQAKIRCHRTNGNATTGWCVQLEPKGTLQQDSTCNYETSFTKHGTAACNNQDWSTS